MNYVQKWLDDNGLKMGERFKTDGGYYNTYYIDSDYELMGSEDVVENDLLVELLTGETAVIKIEPEPKTRIERIKKNGVAWFVNGKHKVQSDTREYDTCESIVGGFATREDAIFESKRRVLEEDMRDWQEVNDAYGVGYYFLKQDSEGIRTRHNFNKSLSGDFRVWFKNKDSAEKCIEVFKERLEDLYKMEGEKV